MLFDAIHFCIQRKRIDYSVLTSFTHFSLCLLMTGPVRLLPLLPPQATPTSPRCSYDPRTANGAWSRNAALPTSPTAAFSQLHQLQLSRSQLQPRCLLILMDFTSVYLTPKIGHKVETSTVQDFIIVMEFIDQTGRRCREYLDFLCDCAVTNKNDYHFVLCTWLFLFLRKMIFCNTNTASRHRRNSLSMIFSSDA